MKYKCTACHYETDRKSSIERHEKSNKHIEKVKEQSNVQMDTRSDAPRIQENPLIKEENSINNGDFECNYCGQKFSIKTI